MSLNLLKRGPPPGGEGTALGVLDGLAGTRSAALDLLWDRAWPGADIAGVAAFRPRPIRLARAQAATVDDFAPPTPGFSAPKGAVIVEGAIVTAAAVLAGIDAIRERAAVEDVIRRHGLDRSSAADLLAARAYVWTMWMAPWSHRDLPYSGPASARAAELILRYEQTHPGTTGLAVSGRSRAAMASIDALIREAVAGAEIFEPLQRTSAVDKALGTTSKAARSILRLRTGQQWVAHHLIPFGVMVSMPVPVQKAIVAAGWVMDTAENLMALPGNLQAYMSQPTQPPRPYQQGPHPNYDADVAGYLAVIATAGTPMSGPALRAALLAVEKRMTRRILAGDYNPKVD